MKTLMSLALLVLLILVGMGVATVDFDWSAMDWSIFTNAKEEVLSWVGQ